MKKYHGVIFDLDGTLLNTINDLGSSVNDVLKYYGLPEHSIEEYMKMVGNGMKRLLLSSLPPEQTERIDIEQAFDMFQKIYAEKYMEHTVPYDGIPELVEWLYHSGIKLAVNSNKRDDYTKSLIDKYFTHIPFVQVLGERPGIPRKPDPSAALEIAAEMGESPEKLLYIGDSEVDIETGKNAGMDTVGVIWGFRGRGGLDAVKAVYIAESPVDIRSLF